MEKSKSRTFFYACENKKAPDLDRQLDALRALGAEEQNLFVDRADRKNYSLLKHDLLHTGDTLVIQSLHCLGLHKAEMSRQLEFFVSNSICLKVIDLPVTMADSAEGHTILIGTLMCQMLMMFDRWQPQKKPGRKPPVMPDNWEEVCCRYLNHEIKASKAMELTGIKPSVFYKCVSDYKKSSKGLKWSKPKD